MKDYEFTVTFKAWVSADNESNAVEKLNEMLNILGDIDTGESAWDEVEWSNAKEIEND
jgi:uncharacterized alpha/beta hydrolase family protein